MRALIEKTNESLSSVIPITAIVLLLSISIAPLTPGALILFLFGAVLLVVGMGLFTLGVDMSMTPMGEGIGVELAKRKRMGIPLLVVLHPRRGGHHLRTGPAGAGPPDPQHSQHDADPGRGTGRGRVPVPGPDPHPAENPLSRCCWCATSLFSFWPSARRIPFLSPWPFDSGGVTTGPITVPFIMALGIGMASMRER